MQSKNLMQTYRRQLDRSVAKVQKSSSDRTRKMVTFSQRSHRVAANTKPLGYDHWMTFGPWRRNDQVAYDTFAIRFLDCIIVSPHQRGKSEVQAASISLFRT